MTKKPFKAVSIDSLSEVKELDTDQLEKLLTACTYELQERSKDFHQWLKDNS